MDKPPSDARAFDTTVELAEQIHRVQIAKRFLDWQLRKLRAVLERQYQDAGCLPGTSHGRTAPPARR